MLVIDNVPIIGPERQQKLLETIIKRFKTHAGIDVNIDGIHVPYGDDKQSKG